MKIIYFAILFFLASDVLAEPAKISYGECVVTLPDGFVKSETTEYFYSLDNNFKSVALSKSENPEGFFDDSSEVKSLKVYKAKNFYVFYYELWLDQNLKDKSELLDFVLLWRTDKSLSFTGFDVLAVKALMDTLCSEDWIAFNKKDFLSGFREGK